MVQPASRYSFGCSDLVSASAVASLYSVPMSPVDSTKFARLDLESQVPTSVQLQALGALDCSWYDGKKTDDTSHDMEVEVMPVTLAQWNRFALGGADTLHNGVDIECAGDSGYNSCQYEAYVNGSRFTLLANNIKVVPTAYSVLPPAVKTVVTAIAAKIASAPVLPAAAAQQPSVTLPASGTALLTSAQIRSAFGLPATAKVLVDCSETGDGPWEIDAEAIQELDGSEGCELGPPFMGQETAGGYAGLSWLPAGSWAASDLESDTAGETQVSDPSLPAGDSLYQFTDAGGDLDGDLVIGGNLIGIEVYAQTDPSEPKGTVPIATALVNVANALETTLRP